MAINDRLPKTLTEDRVVELIRHYVRRELRKALSSNLTDLLAVTDPVTILNPGSSSASLGVKYDGSTIILNMLGELESVGGGGGLAVGDFVFNEVPAGTIDGSNDTFTLAAAPEAGTVQLFRNGLLMQPGAGNDYTISSLTVTFETDAIPDSGASLLAHYIKA